jgi:hypothetical protein
MADRPKRSAGVSAIHHLDLSRRWVAGTPVKSHFVDTPRGLLGDFAGRPAMTVFLFCRTSYAIALLKARGQIAPLLDVAVAARRWIMIGLGKSRGR